MMAPKTSRGAIGWLGALLAAMFSAATFAIASVLFLASSPLAIFGYLAIIPLLLVGLGAGSMSGLIATLLGTGTVYLALRSEYVAMAYLVVASLPALILIVMAMRYRQAENGKIYWYPEGYLLTALSVYCCIIFVIFALVSAIAGNDLLSSSTQMLQTYFAPVKSEIKAEDLSKFDVGVTKFAETLPMITASMWILLIILSALVAQVTLKQQNWLLRTPFALNNIYLPNWLIGALITAGLCGTLGAKPLDYYGMNISLILCIPFFFVGLTVVHAAAATIKYKRSALVLFYLFIFAMPKVDVLVFLAVLGVLDQGLNLRQRLARQPKLT